MRAGVAVAGVLIVLGLGLGVRAPVADASCGGVQRVKPARKPAVGRPPLAIGDSTMLLALPKLARVGYAANARGCRGFDEGLAVLRRVRHAHQLPHLVVMALGTDWSISPRQVDAALRIVGPERVLGLVTPRELGGSAGSDAAVVREMAARHPQRIKLLDWVAYSDGHPGWFQPDGCHLTFSGASAFASLLRRALPLAAPQPMAELENPLSGH